MRAKKRFKGRIWTREGWLNVIFQGNPYAAVDRFGNNWSWFKRSINYGVLPSPVLIPSDSWECVDE